jgi:hypothetical protein
MMATHGNLAQSRSATNKWQHVEAHDAWTRVYEFAAVPGFSRTREQAIAVRREGDHWRADLSSMMGFETLTPIHYPTAKAARDDVDHIMYVFKQVRAKGAEMDLQSMVGNDGRIRWHEVTLLSGIRDPRDRNLAGVVLSPAAIASQLTERQRATLAWIFENWPYPYRGTPREDVDGLVALGLLHPYTEERWGDATSLGRGVWKHARRQWRRETALGAKFKHANLAGDPGPAGPEAQARNVEIATTIAQQLGGGTRRLGAMIGAHGFTAGDSSLSFRFKAKAKNGSNAMRIVLEPSDTYRVEFLSIRGTSVKSKGVFEDVYAEDLKRIFEGETGLYLSL